MEISVLINIIGIAITLTSIGITAYTINQSKSEFRAVSLKRQKAMSGIWSGKYEQIDPIKLGDETSERPSGNVTLNLDAGKRTIKGEITLEWTTGLDRTDKWFCKGGFKSERFLEITFQNRDDKIIQFGSLLMELDPLGKNLSGRVQGFGPTSGRVISGLVELTTANASK